MAAAPVTYKIRWKTRFACRPRLSATSMRCTHANWVVLFTTLFNTFVLGLYATVENEQYSVKQLTELPFSRCCWSCLKAMYRNMPRWRAEVDVGRAFTRHARTLWGYGGLALSATDCDAAGWHVGCFQSCYWCGVELPTRSCSLNTSMNNQWRAVDLFLSVVVFANQRLQHAAFFYNTNVGQHCTG